MSRQTMAASGYDPSLYRWKGQQSKQTKIKTDQVPFSVSYHEKQTDIKKWIKNVDVAADEALRKHLRGRGQYDDSPLWISPALDGIASSGGEEQDAVTEASKLLSTYMARSGDPLAEVQLMDSQSFPYYEPDVVKTEIPLTDALDPLGEAQFVLNTLDGAPSLAVPHWTTTMDAFVPLEDQVRDEVDSVMDHLLEVPIDRVRTSRQRDPQLQMEARHLQVKDRSHKRQQQQAKKKETEQIHVDAKKLLAEQSSQAEAKQKLEDMLLAVEVKKLRKQVKDEKHELEQVLKHRSVDVKNTDRNPRKLPARADGSQPSVRGTTSRPPAVGARKQHQHGKSTGGSKSQDPIAVLKERKNQADVSAARRQSTRNVLEVQLREAEEQERRDELKLLHSVFTAWYSAVSKRQKLLSQACATLNWRWTFRFWTRWKSEVRKRQLRKEEEEVSRLAMRDKRLAHNAEKLHNKLILRKCLWAWKRFTEQSRVLGDTFPDGVEPGDEPVAQRRMDDLLNAIASGALASKIQEEEDAKLGKTVSGKKPHHCHTEDARKQELTHQPTAPALVTVNTAARYKDQQASAAQLKSNVPARGINSLTVQAAGNKRPGRRPTVNKRSAVGEEHAATANAADQVSHAPVGMVLKTTGMGDIERQALLPLRQQPSANALPPSQTETVLRPRAANIKESCSKVKMPAVSSDQRVSQNSMAAKKSAVLTAMEERTAAIAARKQQREQRKKEAEEKRLIELRRIDDENRAAQEAEKVAALEKRREEKRKQREAEQRKEKAVRLQQELTQKACIHHTKSLLKFYGFRPWRVFLKHVHLQQITARECCDKRLLQSHFYCWRHRRQDKERWRERCADNLHQRQMLRVHFQLWHKEIFRSRAAQHLATEHSDSLHLRRHFLAWKSYCRDLKRDQWEKERKALVHNNKRLKRNYFKLWQDFLPLQRQEAEQEKRRQLLRARVSQWLPDYNPTDEQREEKE